MPGWRRQERTVAIMFSCQMTKPSERAKELLEGLAWWFSWRRPPQSHARSIIAENWIDVAKSSSHQVSQYDTDGDGVGRRPAVRRATAKAKEPAPRNSTGTQTARRMPFMPQGKPALQGNDESRTRSRLYPSIGGACRVGLGAQAGMPVLPEGNGRGQIEAAKFG